MTSNPSKMGTMLPFVDQCYAVVDLDTEDKYGGDRAGRLTSDPSVATTVTSLINDGSGMHRPVLDIDLPAALVPSSTPGHYHLYLDKPMTWEAYRKLLEALAEAGVIEPGYANASIDRGRTDVRLPWIKKGGAAS